MSHPQEFAPEAALDALGLPQWGPDVELVQPLGHGDPGNAMYTGEPAAISVGNMVLLVFLCFSPSPLAPGFKGPLYLIFLCCSGHQALKGPPSLGSTGQLLALACGERGYSDGSTLCMWLSSIGLPPRLPSFPSKVFPASIYSLMSPSHSLPAVKGRSHTGIALQSPQSSSEPPHIPGDSNPVQGM